MQVDDGGDWHIDGNGRGKTHATIRTAWDEYNLSGDSFIVSGTVTPDGPNDYFFYLSNDTSDSDIVIDEIEVQRVGGTTIVTCERSNSGTPASGTSATIQNGNTNHDDTDAGTTAEYGTDLDSASGLDTTNNKAFDYMDTALRDIASHPNIRLKNGKCIQIKESTGHGSAVYFKVMYHRESTS